MRGQKGSQEREGVAEEESDENVRQGRQEGSQGGTLGGKCLERLLK